MAGSRMTCRLLAVWALCVGICSSACGGGGSDADSQNHASCPADDPATPTNEAECKELATSEAGGLAVKRRSCVNCHGQNMAGSTTMLPGIPDTPLGEKVELYPPNLTPDPETGVAPPSKGGQWTDEALALAIRSGVDNKSQNLCPQMQHFSDMSDFEVYSIVKYLRAIPAVRNKVLRSVCPPFKTKEEQGI